ncbi:MAG: hypothetical protein IJO62_00815 [Clostridia bacterium]|nr:hypothetical protein [Clostridia bacterium]
MYYCKNCGNDFEEPEKTYETHNLSDTPFELYYVCPHCKSGNFYEKSSTHCRCCGSRLPKGATEYCCDSCRIKGEKLWRRELKRRKDEMVNPLKMIVRECSIYNQTHNTDYSYGQYVAIIKPKLLKEAKKCAKKKKNI